MSTRANIFYNRINDSEHNIENRKPFYDGETEFFYSHCDGYPEGVGQDLKDIIAYQVESKTEKPLIERLYEYFEETNSVHSDINYLYAVTESNTEIMYQCFKYDMFDKRPDYQNIIITEKPLETVIYQK